MFDIGFTELLLISLVALIVVGPERLPKLARTVGTLMGRLQRYVSDVKADINRELHLEELRKMQQQVQQSAADFELSINKELTSARQSLDSVAADVSSAGASETIGSPGADFPHEANGASEQGDRAAVPATPQLELDLAPESRRERAA